MAGVMSTERLIVVPYGKQIFGVQLVVIPHQYGCRERPQFDMELASELERAGHRGDRAVGVIRAEGGVAQTGGERGPAGVRRGLAEGAETLGRGRLERLGVRDKRRLREAGQRELAPPSNFSNEGGLRNSVLIDSRLRRHPLGSSALSASGRRWKGSRAYCESRTPAASGPWGETAE